MQEVFKAITLSRVPPKLTGIRRLLGILCLRLAVHHRIGPELAFRARGSDAPCR
jgi:hypothetical protein